MAAANLGEQNGTRPGGAARRGEVRAIILVLSAWLVVIVAAQAVVYVLEQTGRGGALNGYTFFNLPLSYWLTGQFLPLWFILLCGVFNFWMDRHAGRTPDSTLRFRVRGDLDREEE